jgi:hypothetical protein
MIHFETKTEHLQNDLQHGLAAPRGNAGIRRCQRCQHVPGHMQLHTYLPQNTKYAQHRITSTQGVPSSHTIWNAGNGDSLLQ